MPQPEPTSSDDRSVPVSQPMLKLMAEMGSQLSAYSDAAELQLAVLGRAVEIFRCDGGLLSLCDGSPESLKPPVAVVANRTGREGDFLTNRGVVTVVFGQKRSAIFNDPGRQLGPSCEELSSLMVAPLLANQQIVGVMALVSTDPGRKFEPADQALLQVVANFAASVLATMAQFDCFSDDLRLKIVDATRELNRVSAELSRVKSFNENIFESISMGIIVFDRSFSVVFRNRLADQFFPGDRSIIEAMARTDITARYGDYERLLKDVVRLGQVCHFDNVRYKGPAAAADELAGRSGAAAGGAAHLAASGAHAAHAAAAADRQLTLRLMASPLIGGREAIVGGILTVEDVTSNVTMERRLAASERLAAVGRLASKVAHELNNPLDGIMRFISLSMRVSQGQPDQRPTEYLKEAQKGLQRMARIVGELLEFSRSTTRQQDDGNIRTAIEDAIKSLQGKADQQQVQVRLRMADDVPPMESTSLCQVFTNLVKNAIEAMPAGGLVTVEALLAAGAIEVRVADSGAGIPEDKLQMVFEPFFSTKEAGQGTGLGLAISREIVEKHGGTLLARNRPEGGAEFVVRIPTEWARR